MFNCTNLAKLLGLPHPRKWAKWIEYPDVATAHTGTHVVNFSASRKARQAPNGSMSTALYTGQMTLVSAHALLDRLTARSSGPRMWPLLQHVSQEVAVAWTRQLHSLVSWCRVLTGRQVGMPLAFSEDQRQQRTRVAPVPTAQPPASLATQAAPPPPPREPEPQAALADSKAAALRYRTITRQLGHDVTLATHQGGSTRAGSDTHFLPVKDFWDMVQAKPKYVELFQFWRALCGNTNKARGGGEPVYQHANNVTAFWFWVQTASHRMSNKEICALDQVRRA